MVTIANLRQPGIDLGASHGDTYKIGIPMKGESLQRNAVRTTANGDRGRLILCHRGVIWITQEFDPYDYVLHPGDVFIVTQPGKVVLQALGEAEFQLVDALRTAPFQGRSIHFK